MMMTVTVTTVFCFPEMFPNSMLMHILSAIQNTLSNKQTQNNDTSITLWEKIVRTDYWTDVFATCCCNLVKNTHMACENFR